MANSENTDHPDEGIDTEILHELAEAQKEEAQVRREEQELKRFELEQNAEHARHSLEAQLKDLERERSHEDRIHKRNQRYGLALFFLGFTFLGFLVWNGQANMALEVIKVIVYGGAGYVAGKQYGRGLAKSESSSSASE